jgi:cytochrome c oxidase assembly protein subunit 15
VIAVRRWAYAALVVAYTHLVFGAIVRISGSGMGCGDHWPKCYGRWFPPMDRPDLIIEVTHRYLASILGLVALGLAIAAWRRRHEIGTPGVGDPARPALGAFVAVLVTAGLGAVTVKLGNSPMATVAHWLLAMTTLGLLAVTAIRAGGFGAGSAASLGTGSRRTMSGAIAAATLAFLTAGFGSVTAKYPGGAVACLSFPLCGGNPDVSAGARGIQLTHRSLAYLLFFHTVATSLAIRKRRASESPAALRALRVAAGLVVLQVLIAGAMIGMHLPPAVRSAHQAVGVAIWLSLFTFAYVARRAWIAASAPAALAR